MAECSECGEKSMSFKCHYCGEKYCSEHRLPEKHDCTGLKSGKNLDNSEEWFEKKFSEKKDNKPSKGQKKDNIVKNSVPYRTHRKSLTKDLMNTVTGSFTLMIIGITVLSYFLQLNVPRYEELLILDTNISELLLRPWSLLTVILLHGPLFHIFGNMVTFYFFASPVEKLVGGMEMLKIYLVSALLASLAMVGFHNVLRVLHGDASMAGLVVGASGGVIALVGVVGKLYPEARVLLFFIIPMKIKTAVYGVGAFEAINISLTLLQIEFWIMPIEFFASAGHLAGLIVGLWYGKKLKQKYSTSSTFNPLGY